MKNNLFKIFNISINIFIYVFLILSLFLLIFTITSKKDSDDSINIFNHQFRIVISPSMEKSNETYDNIKKYKIKDIKVKSLLVIEKVSNKDKWYDDIKIGDVLTFKYTYDNKQETITHRVIGKEIKENKDGYIITLQGDNKVEGSFSLAQVIDTSDETSTNYIIGKVKTKSYLLGLIIYSLKQPLGTILLVIIPCLIIIVLEIIKIISAINSNKKNKEQIEIEELKKKLALLEQQQLNNNE